ncbi:unnamed protein product [Anisakis simplex]|uniref:Endoplasmic reticulum metallopeptidase 1/1-A TM domain-containing protein n=1 Tax=Anisakis simplex TaxID=6269 RepID=A0A3P6NLV6_ANISI|nr:unnamed protein product [Anisakis simplex]
MDLVMCWYKLPELVFPLYIFPMLLAGCTAHTIIAQRSKIRNAEMVHFDSILLIFATILAVMTFYGIASAFFLLIHALFPLFRDPIIYLLGKLKIIDRVSTRCLLCAQLLCTVPVIVFATYAVMMLFDFFVPLSGRTGNVFNPELIIMPLSFLTAFSFVLYTNNLMYVSRRLDYLMKCGFALFVLFFAVIATTRLGWPYQYTKESPRLRRIVALVRGVVAEIILFVQNSYKSLVAETGERFERDVLKCCCFGANSRHRQFETIRFGFATESIAVDFTFKLIFRPYCLFCCFLLVILKALTSISHFL